VARVPRLPRIQAEDAIYHVTANAARRLLLFTDRADRETFIRILAIATSKADWLCHSYCLMGTHFHLLLETPEPNIAYGMQRLNWLYSRSFNQRHGLRGHCFEGRYEAELVQSERHFLNTARYIARNPVEAGLCESPLGWEWSSYRATLGLVEPPDFLYTQAVLSSFDDRPEVARRMLREFVEDAAPRSLVA
jgi:putative transposase